MAGNNRREKKFHLYFSEVTMKKKSTDFSTVVTYHKKYQIIKTLLLPSVYLHENNTLLVGTFNTEKGRDFESGAVFLVVRAKGYHGPRSLEIFKAITTIALQRQNVCDALFFIHPINHVTGKLFIAFEQSQQVLDFLLAKGRSVEQSRASLWIRGPRWNISKINIRLGCVDSGDECHVRVGINIVVAVSAKDRGRGRAVRDYFIASTLHFVFAIFIVRKGGEERIKRIF